jgi:hypothetical protein
MLSEEKIFDTVQPHLPRMGHALIWDTDPEYAKDVGIEVGSRWIMNDVHPEHTVAAARAIEAAATTELRERLAKVQAERDELRALIANDAHACTFQSLGQYRTALLAAIARTEGEAP